MQILWAVESLIPVRHENMQDTLLLITRYTNRAWRQRHPTSYEPRAEDLLLYSLTIFIASNSTLNNFQVVFPKTVVLQGVTAYRMLQLKFGCYFLLSTVVTASSSVLVAPITKLYQCLSVGTHNASCQTHLQIRWKEVTQPSR